MNTTHKKLETNRHELFLENRQLKLEPKDIQTSKPLGYLEESDNWEKIQLGLKSLQLKAKKRTTSSLLNSIRQRACTTPQS